MARHCAVRCTVVALAPFPPRNACTHTVAPGNWCGGHPDWRRREPDLDGVPLRHLPTPGRVHAPCPGRFGATGAESQCELNLLSFFFFHEACSGRCRPCTSRTFAYDARRPFLPAPHELPASTAGSARCAGCNCQWRAEHYLLCFPSKICTTQTDVSESITSTSLQLSSSVGFLSVDLCTIHTALPASPNFPRTCAGVLELNSATLVLPCTELRGIAICRQQSCRVLVHVSPTAQPSCPSRQMLC
jgi:hypothetical protein